MNQQQNTHRLGSIYVLTLFTVAAVGSMVLIGAAIRSASSSNSSIIEQMNENSSGVLDASELALARIVDDEEWITNAQKGAVFSNLEAGSRIYSSTVLDADTLAVPTDSTTEYRVTVSSSTGITKESARLDIRRVTFDYHAYLETIRADAYWPLNEGSRANTADEPEEGRDGTYQDPYNPGGARNDEGGLVPLFDMNNDHVETPYTSSYQDDTEGTVSFWMQLTGSSNVTTYGIFGQRFTANGMPAVSLTCTAGSLSAYMDDSGSFSWGHFAQTPFGTINVGEWHHVAMSWGPAGLMLYVDGVEVARNGTCTEYWDTQDGFFGRQPLLIGAGYIVSSGSQPMTGFEGSVARFAILEDQLSASTIAELAAIKPDKQEIQLIEQSWTRVYE